MLGSLGGGSQGADMMTRRTLRGALLVAAALIAAWSGGAVAAETPAEAAFKLGNEYFKARLVDKADGRPIGNRRIEYGIRIVSPGGGISHRLWGETTTDASGRFLLEGLVAGAKYALNLPMHEEDAPIGDRLWRTLGEFTNPGPDTLDLGDFECDPTPR